MATPHPIRLAFVGTGHWARASHLPALQYIRANLGDEFDLQLHGIYGIEDAEASQLRKQHGFAKQYRGLGELVDDESVDAVAVVISPSATREVVLRLLQFRSVPLLTEKPPGGDYAEARDLAERVRSLHLVAFNRRYKPLNERFRQLVSNAGPVKRVGVQMYRQDRREPHFVLHTGIHVINYVEYLCGPIITLHTKLAPVADGAEASAEIGFVNGARGDIHFAPKWGEVREAISIETETQRISIECPLNDYPGFIDVEGDIDLLGVRGAAEHPHVVREGFVDEYLELFRAMTAGSPVRSTFQNAANSMRIAEAIENGQDIHPV